jgi:hypothetical protein
VALAVSWKTAYPWLVEANSCYHTRHKEANQSYERYTQIEFVHSCSVSIYVTQPRGLKRDHLVVVGEEDQNKNPLILVTAQNSKKLEGKERTWFTGHKDVIIV